MKRTISLIILLGLIFCLNIEAFAQYTANASPQVVGVNTSISYVNITFPYPTRNLIVENNDSSDYVYVDINSDTNTFDVGSCYLLGPGDDLTLYDYMTEGISILRDTTYSTGDTASPISVISTY